MKTIIKNALIVNEGRIEEGDILINADRIEKIGGIIDGYGLEIIAENKWVIPGIIDDQVHFREPGYTDKADIYSESKSAVAGGVTSFMEMPNTRPPAITKEVLEEKYAIANKNAWCNYSFFMGTTNDNFKDIQTIDFKNVCGLKIFMGSSTGNMLVDDKNTLENIFANVETLIATHCEDESTILQRQKEYTEQYGAKLNASYHPIIRNEEACYLSSSYAVELAKKHNTRLHVLHISTEEEISLFSNSMPLEKKRITSEVCVHHLTFTADDYELLGNKIKCNPAIKDKRHAPQLLAALLDDRLDIIATDHAPHLLSEKELPYAQAPSGLPLVQHALNMMLDLHWQGKISIEKIVEKMCHTPAICFTLKERGYLREGYFADIAIVDKDKMWRVSKDNLLYKCGWSPLEGKEFKGAVKTTIVNGNVVFSDDKHTSAGMGQRLKFAARR